MKVSFALSEKAKSKLKEAIKDQVGAKAEKIVFALHDRVLDATPMNTGRTLASWRVTRDVPSNYDAVQTFPWLDHYEQNITSATNHLPIGAEPGRSLFVSFAKYSRSELNIRKDPYHKFYVSNAASLDSLFQSSLSQEAGSRAFYLDSGAVPGYDVYNHPNGTTIFDPRGLGFYRISVASFLLKAKSI